MLGCRLVSLHFLCYILCCHTVLCSQFLSVQRLKGQENRPNTSPHSRRSWTTTPHVQRSLNTFPPGFGETMAAKLRHSAILWWAAEHFEGNSPDLAGTFLHNSVDFVVDGTSRISKEKKGLSPLSLPSLSPSPLSLFSPLSSLVRVLRSM